MGKKQLSEYATLPSCLTKHRFKMLPSTNVTAIAQTSGLRD
jgi:hypothetical protein